MHGCKDDSPKSEVPHPEGGLCQWNLHDDDTTGPACEPNWSEPVGNADEPGETNYLLAAIVVTITGVFILASLITFHYNWKRRRTQRAQQAHTGQDLHDAEDPGNQPGLGPWELSDSPMPEYTPSRRRNGPASDAPERGTPVVEGSEHTGTEPDVPAALSGTPNILVVEPSPEPREPAEV